jgi:surfactin synthase thioesterase subunit
LRNDFSLLDHYVHSPETICSFPFLLFGGSEDIKVPIVDIELWSKETNGNTTLHIIKGDHFFIRRPEKMLSLIVDALEIA